MKKVIALLLLTLLLAPVLATSQSAHLPEKGASPLATYWAGVFERGLGKAAVGYSYVILRHGEIIAAGSKGYAKAPLSPQDKGIPFKVDTRLQIASCSKPITAVALLHELEKKHLSVDTPIWPLIREQFPTVGAGVEGLTIRHLLTHKTGYDFGYLHSPLRENAKKLLAQPLPHAPGQNARYSNINYGLAHLVLEIISGRDYESYVREEILRPAASEGMALKVAAEDGPYYYNFGSPVSEGKPISLDFTDEAGPYGWYATAREVARVLRKVRTNSYLSPRATTQMFEEGLGWNRTVIDSQPVYFHDGQWIEDGVGTRSGVMIFPDDVEAVVLINTNGPFAPNNILLRGFTGCYPRMRFDKANDKGKAFINIEPTLLSSEIRWTDDGSEPSKTSKLFQGAIIADLPVTIRCAEFIKGEPATFVSTLKIDK